MTTGDTQFPIYNCCVQEASFVFLIPLLLSEIKVIFFFFFPRQLTVQIPDLYHSYSLYITPALGLLIPRARIGALGPCTAPTGPCTLGFGGSGPYAAQPSPTCLDQTLGTRSSVQSHSPQGSHRPAGKRWGLDGKAPGSDLACGFEHPCAKLVMAFQRNFLSRGFPVEMSCFIVKIEMYFSRTPAFHRIIMLTLVPCWDLVQHPTIFFTPEKWSAAFLALRSKFHLCWKVPILYKYTDWFICVYFNHHFSFYKYLLCVKNILFETTVWKILSSIRMCIANSCHPQCKSSREGI